MEGKETKLGLAQKVFKKQVNARWHKADDLPNLFGADMLVVDYRKGKPNVTVERYDSDMKEWFSSHPAAIWADVYDFLPNHEKDF